jgi:hypothetical protein
VGRSCHPNIVVGAWIKEGFKMSFIKHFYNGFKEGFREFGQSINSIVNTGLLLFVYIIGSGFTFILAKISRKHFLETKLSDEADSYWIDVHSKEESFEDYLRQF